MTIIHVPGIGDVDLDLATASYRTFDDSMGVPIRTSVGMWRARPKALFVSELAPYGIFNVKPPLRRDEFERRYITRLNSKGVTIVEKLAHLALDHPGERLVLLCWEDVHVDGEWCHRTMAARWLRDQLGVEVPEISPAPAPPAQAHLL